MVKHILARKYLYVTIPCYSCGLFIERMSPIEDKKYFCFDCRRDNRKVSVKRYSEKRKNQHMWEDFLDACEIKKLQVARERAAGLSSEETMRFVTQQIRENNKLGLV